MNRTERALAELLAEHSLMHRPRKPFTLASGKTSAFYFDCRRTTMHPAAMPLIGRLFAKQLDERVVAVGGLTMGADPIACAIAYATSKSVAPRRAFSVRKEPKSHGTEAWIEGAVRRRESVAVVEDVVTTGGSTINAIRRCREEGLVVRQVITLVDREEGGLDAIKQELGRRGTASAIFARSEIDAVWASLRGRQ